MGTPGIVGHRAGRDHSTRFAVSAVDIASEGEGDRSVQRLTVRAADGVADLALTVAIEMLGTGLVRARATIGSTGEGSGDAGAPYELGSVTLALPVPAAAVDLLGEAGTPRLSRHIRAVVAGRNPGGLHRSCRRAPRGSDSRAGEVWAAHVAWSGNTRHLAERGAEGVPVLLGGAEMLHPGEVRLAQGDSYATPWVYFSSRSGARRCGVPIPSRAPVAAPSPVEAPSRRRDHHRRSARRRGTDRRGGRRR